MVITARPHRERPRAARGGPGPLRLAVFIATAAACVPYLALKAAWLSGSTVGYVDADAAGASVRHAGNAITMGMDAMVVAVAAAFTFRWGQRIPAWPVLAPMWVATGLLAPILLAVPLGSALQAVFSSEPLTAPDDAMRGWVYGVVYTGFTLQGIGLATAFVLYARSRWADVFKARTGDVAEGAPHRAQVLLAHAAAVPAVLYAAVQLFWAFGATAGLGAERAGQRTAVQQLADGAEGLLALAGAAALLLILRRGGRRPVLPLAVAWTGAATTFAAPLYGLLAAAAQPALDGPESTTVLDLTAVCGVLAGLLMGATGVALLAGRGAQSARPTASSAP
ncbi:hypothetical protein ACN3XK_44020 [Actinomadura welshii]